VDAYVILRAPFASTGSPTDGESSPSGGTRADLVSSMYGMWLSGLSTDILAELRAKHLHAIAEEDEAQAAKRERYRLQEEAKKKKAQEEAVETASPCASSPREDEEEKKGAKEDDDVMDDSTNRSSECQPEQLRAKSFAVVDALPVQSSKLGFATRARDTACTPAAWLAEVTGDQVETELESEAATRHQECCDCDGGGPWAAPFATMQSPQPLTLGSFAFGYPQWYQFYQPAPQPVQVVPHSARSHSDSPDTSAIQVHGYPLQPTMSSTSVLQSRRYNVSPQLFERLRLGIALTAEEMDQVVGGGGGGCVGSGGCGPTTDKEPPPSSEPVIESVEVPLRLGGDKGDQRRSMMSSFGPAGCC